MLTNADCTVYSLTTNRIYTATVITGVFWSETNAYNIQKYGVANASKGTVYIGINDFKPSKDDYIVKGEIDFVVDNTVGHLITDLLKNYEAFKVVAVDTFNFGSSDMQHYEVSIK